MDRTPGQPLQWRRLCQKCKLSVLLKALLVGALWVVLVVLWLWLTKWMSSTENRKPVWFTACQRFSFSCVSLFSYVFLSDSDSVHWPCGFSDNDKVCLLLWFTAFVKAFLSLCFTLCLSFFSQVDTTLSTDLLDHILSPDPESLEVLALALEKQDIYK